MDIYGLPSNTSSQDLFPIDDLLDFSNEQFFTSSSSAAATATATGTTSLTADNNHLPPPQYQSFDSFTPSFLPSDFTDDLCVPSDDVAELEWLSQIVDDSFTDFPTNSVAGTMTVRSDTSLSGGGRSKRSKATNSEATTTTWNWTTSETGKKRETDRKLSPTPEKGVRRCTHCSSEKTPQWRTGPLGPKTLCNACGVRYKSGRLVPEYRPAASPTFVLTQHSNSHRKVLELRRQKELLRLQKLHHHQQGPQKKHGQGQIYRHQRDFEVC